MEGVGNAFGLFMVSNAPPNPNTIAMLDIDLHIFVSEVRLLES